MKLLALLTIAGVAAAAVIAWLLREDRYEWQAWVEPEPGGWGW